jgi:hypothetical protein
MYRSLHLMLAALGMAAIFGTAAPAGAATLATGVLETTNTTQIRCWLGNVSTQPLTYTICSVGAFTGNVFDCRSGAVDPGSATLLIGGSNGGEFYCRFTVSSRSAARATAALTSFITGSTFAVIEAR